MVNSDSGTESECFESAEESFDENEEIKSEKTKTIKNAQKSENRNVKPAVSDSKTFDSVQVGESNTSSISLSYRKRPERVKRLPNTTQTKSVVKASTNDLIFKTNKIVSDVSFQDITSNLSKNLNKSLNTLQQTSSNVKDLILNSLPVSSVGDSEEFTYDDNTSVADEHKILSNETSHQINDRFMELKENFIKQSSKNEGISKEEILYAQSNLPIPDRVSDSDEQKLKDLRSDNLEEDHIPFKDNTGNNNFMNEVPNFEKENLEKCSSTCLNSDTLEILTDNYCSGLINIDSTKAEKIIQDINVTCLNYENIETLTGQEEVNNKYDIKAETVDFKKDTGPEIEMDKKNESIHIKTNINEEVIRKEETLKLEKFFKSVKAGNTECNLNLNMCYENDINNLKEKNKTDIKCNLEELKMVLKNIVKEENIFGKKNVKLVDNEEVNQISLDGWDDFDFSDNEVESFNVNKHDKYKKSEETKTNDDLLKYNQDDSNIKPVNDFREVEINKFKNLVLSEENLEAISVPTKSHAKSSVKNTNLVIAERSDSKGECCEKAENPKKCRETDKTENDSWDWDNWGDTSENKEVEVTQTEELAIKKAEDNSLDVSKWSGWDTFAQKPQEKQDNWSLGSWGVDMLLHKASVVSQGISSVLEAGLGAPDPETLARMERIQNENLFKPEEEVTVTENELPIKISQKEFKTNVNIFPVSGITSLVAGVTSKIVEHSKIHEIGSKVITGGLETLETFGKKTMEVLQEGDPGLRNKRALLLGNKKPVLSQVLKEAREKADKESKKAEEKELAKKCNFETLFDDFQGMVHLEALEMLSRQCELKMDQIRSGMDSEEQEDLNGILEEVEQLCSLDEYDIDMKSSGLDFKTLLQMSVEPLKNEISIQNIIQIHEDVNKWLQISSETEPSFTTINQKLVSTLAELTAAAVHQFHKSGELLTVKECRKTVEEVDVLSRLTNALCTEISKLGEKFIQLSPYRSLKGVSDDDIDSIKEKVNMVTKNSILYIKQAFYLLIPVIQFGAAV